MLGEGGLSDLHKQAQELQRLEDENAQLAERNRILAAELEALRSGTEGIEGLAREQLGMIRKDEKFYQFIGPGVKPEKPSDDAP